MFENVKCKYRIESPCKICNERKEACWDRCEKYKRYKQETQKQKDFLNGKINYIAVSYEADRVQEARKKYGKG